MATTAAPAEIVAEVEAAALSGSPERRVRILQKLAELFVSRGPRLQPELVRIFDEVMVRLTARIEPSSLAALSTTFVGLSPAPRKTLRHLAAHEDATVAAPILLRSEAISDSELAEIARNRSQRHIQAIAGRPTLSEQLTDLLLKHASRGAMRALAANSGARFSEQGYCALIASAEGDPSTAQLVGLRTELPAPRLRELLSKMTDAARARLRNAAPAELRQRIEAALESIVSEAEPRPEPADYSEALVMVDVLNRIGKLTDSSVNRFAVRREYTNLVAALSVLSGARVDVIEPLMWESGCDGLILACRASRLSWPTTLAVIENRRCGRPPKDQLERGKELFETLYVSAAQYTIRFEPPTCAPAKPAAINNVLPIAEAHR